jgi:beta-galactosidase
MNSRILNITAGLVLPLGFLVFASFAECREKISLDGVWNFATDTENRGEAEKWFAPDAKLPKMPLPGYAPEADGTIRVPGIWDNQGYGTETEKVRHNFVGKGWYKRQVEIPKSWAGHRAFLLITGVSRYCKVWVNGHFLGEHIGYLSSQEYDVTRCVEPGKTATLVIQVDSRQRWAVDSMAGASSLIDYMDIPWGGIWGHVSIEARADTWLSDLFIQPDVANSCCTISAAINGKTDLPDAVKLELFDADGRHVAGAMLKSDPKIAGQPVVLKTAIPDAKLWTPETPTLYKARLSLMKDGHSLDSAESSFGMRQFTVDGYRLLLNGKRIMLNGYGDDHIYPEQMAMPVDKELHLNRLRLIKSYGFNHVRHHSTIMPPEYYDACDEVGIITTAEFPIAYQVFVPGIGKTWQEKVPTGTDPAPAIETYKREWAAVVTRHRNHPSILCWVMGNELWGGIPLRYDFQRIARRLDPERFFCDSDGLGGVVDRDSEDLLLAMFNVWSSVFDNPTKFKTAKPPKPVISHESGNFVTFSRPDLIDQFRHNVKPFWLTAGREKLNELGLMQEAVQWAEKSEHLYALLHKYNIETLRGNPWLSGYHWWLFQDYWTTSNGLVDHYFRPKSVAKEEVLKFNGPVVLLQDGLQRTYRGKTTLDLKLLVSNFSPDSLRGDFYYEVKAGETSLVKKQLAIKPVPQGELAEAEHIKLEMPDVKAPTALKISVELSAGDTRYANDWSSWVYPAAIRPARSSVPVYAVDSQIEQFKDWGVKPIPPEGALSDRAVYILDGFIDRRVVDAVERGASVVLLGTADQFMGSRPVTFRTSWWKAGGWETRDDYGQNHTGTMVYDHPLTREMAPAGWCDPGWFELIEGANKYVLEGMPSRPDVIVRALPSMMLVEDDALLFEVGVGKGSLIVSGLNHQRAKARPENEWLLARMIDHACTLPHPKSSWPVETLSSLYAASAGCLSGYCRLVANRGEDYVGNSYREDTARTYICRQTKPGNTVDWETVPVSADFSADRATFVFAGGMGNSSQPKTKGFALDIDGREALRFDMPAPERWESPDKRVTLRFEKRRVVMEDIYGLFYLTIPRDMLTPGTPCQLSVHSLGKGSLRWFGLNPYSNAK